jgi:uncharacterized protein (TIGR03435 family)
VLFGASNHSFLLKNDRTYTETEKLRQQRRGGKMRLLIGVFFLVSSWAFSQAPVSRQDFEVTDVKPSASSQSGSLGVILPSGFFRTENMTLKEVIKFVYAVRDEEILGAPSWVDSQRYDITGKAPKVVSVETFWQLPKAPNMAWFYPEQPLRLTLEAFLANRFKLAVHKEEREMDVLALVASNDGVSPQKALDSGKRGNCLRSGSIDRPGVFQAVCENVSIPDVGRMLQEFAPGYANKKVVDLTGLRGAYDLQLEWAARSLNPAQTIPAALEKVGLKLEDRKLPVSVIVVDHVEKAAEN